MSASEEFRQFQVNAFRARRTQNVPDLEERILVPLLAAPMRAASGMSDEVGSVFAAPTPPRLYDLALLFESVTQPRFRRDPAGEHDEHDLVAIEHVPPEFDADEIGEAREWLVREISTRTRLDMANQTCLKQGIKPQTLTLHSDRGAPMTSKCTAQLLADLEVTRSLSRPQVSDDNPFSEAQFKTLKYHPGFPGRFNDIAATIAFCRSFFPWYNTEHRHAGIAMLTPHDVHYGRASQVLEQRERTLRLAWSRHPERFVNGTPEPQPLPQEVWINPPAAAATARPAQ